MLSNFYYEKYAQQRQWELQREAERIRLAAIARPQGNSARRLMNQLEGLLVGLGLQIKPKEQFQPQIKPVTGNL